ncbi:hypothetical protein BJX64DRAFT_153043 [Aspergillus heterothallicus]
MALQMSPHEPRVHYAGSWDASASGAGLRVTVCRRYTWKSVLVLSNVYRDVARLEEKLDSMAAAFTAQTPLSIQKSPLGERRNPNSILGDDLFPTDTEAQDLLTTFQTELSPYFPFVAIPMGTSATELQRTKPFLFSVIMMVSCMNNADQPLAMTQKIREYLGNSTMTKGEKSLDLFQGLLVCLAWYHFQLGLGSQFSSLLHLAMAMVADLGLTREPGTPRRISLDDTLLYSSSLDTDRTVEEKRAYLGCYYLSSVTSICTEDMEPMRFTTYTEDCCRVLESVGGSTDLYLVRLVRLHRMAEIINRTLSVDQYETSGKSSTPILIRLKVLDTELQRMKPMQAPYNLHDSILQLHYFNLVTKLYSVALEDDFSRHELQPSARFDLLSSCLNATKVFLDLFSAVPTRNYLNIPYPIFAAYCFVLGVFSSLMLSTSEGWDSKIVESMLDLEDVIDNFIAKIENSLTSPHEQRISQPPQALTRLITRLRAIQEDQSTKLAGHMNKLAAAHPRKGVNTTDDDTRDLMFPLPHGFSWRFLQP